MSQWQSVTGVSVSPWEDGFFLLSSFQKPRGGLVTHFDYFCRVTSLLIGFCYLTQIGKMLFYSYFHINISCK